MSWTCKVNYGKKGILFYWVNILILKFKNIYFLTYYSGEFAYLKLAEKRNNKVGTFLLRESDVCYDQYFVDVCTKDRYFYKNSNVR